LNTLPALLGTLLLGTLLTLPAVAQPSSTVVEAADPAAAVPATQYRSVFPGTPRGVEEGSTSWAGANADVGQFTRGHVDILKWEAARAAGPTGALPAVARPQATPSTSAGPAMPQR
jgi:hypothetical protein